jgi:hypothetical protein
MQLNGTVDNEIIAKVLEALAPAHAGKIREAFGLPGGVIGRKMHFSQEEKEDYPEELRKLAEAVCPKWSAEDFKPKQWLRAARESVRKLREAQSASALGFLLRKGVQSLANDWYVATPRDWQDYAATASSNNFAEFYAPLYPSTIAGQVNAGERFPEGKVTGVESILVNRKYGIIESFDRELFDDDQTAQIKGRAANLGQSMAITESAFAALRFIGVAASYFNLSVAASQYSDVDTAGVAFSGPWNKTYYGTYGNRLQTYAALGLNPLKQAWSTVLNARTPSGTKIVITPNVLVHSSMDALHAPLLVKPPGGVPYYPAVPGASGSNMGNAASGFPGGVFGANPFMGLGIAPVLARFLPDWAWAIGQKGKGFVFQERDPLEIIQEATASGAAFESDAIRFRSRRRFGCDFVGGGSRFWFLGNPGAGITVNEDLGATGSF